MRTTALKLTRLRREKLQLDLAYETGIRPARLSLLENGHIAPRPGELERLASALGVAVEVLMADVTESATWSAA